MASGGDQLDGYDEEGMVAGENKVLLMVRTVVQVERDDTIVPESPQGTLV